jgi:hypothetical protein
VLCVVPVALGRFAPFLMGLLGTFKCVAAYFCVRLRFLPKELLLACGSCFWLVRSVCGAALGIWRAVSELCGAFVVVFSSFLVLRLCVPIL